MLRRQIRRDLMADEEAVGVDVAAEVVPPEGEVAVAGTAAMAVAATDLDTATVVSLKLLIGNFNEPFLQYS